MDDITAIGRTITLYGQLIDDLRLAEWGELFTEDAVWELPGMAFRGRAEIVAGVGAMEPSEPRQVRHLAFTPVVDVDGDTARAWTDALVLAKLPDVGWQVVSQGRYHDTLVRDGGRWRFSHRALDMDFNPEGAPPLALTPSPSS